MPCGYGYDHVLEEPQEKADRRAYGFAWLDLCWLDADDYITDENVNKIKIKLATKGFSYDIINLAIEEVKNYETY